MRGRLGHSAVSLLMLSAVLGACAGVRPEVPPVPPIGDARDARGVDPCALLTAEQLTTAGLGGVGAPTVAAEGPRCSWHSDGGDLEVTIWTDGGGLATLAANSEPTSRWSRCIRSSRVVAVSAAARSSSSNPAGTSRSYL